MRAWCRRRRRRNLHRHLPRLHCQRRKPTEHLDHVYDRHREPLCGGDDILVTGLQFADGTDPSWSIPSVANGNIAPGTSLEVTLAFRPTVAGEVEGAVSLFSVASNVTGTPSVIQLRGTGTAP
ncbi:MAG TPA: hypothetical protein VGF99_18110 [Myxococcota bacterium]